LDAGRLLALLPVFLVPIWPTPLCKQAATCTYIRLHEVSRTSQ
jgi:hypothetical protein